MKYNTTDVEKRLSEFDCMQDVITCVLLRTGRSYPEQFLISILVENLSDLSLFYNALAVMEHDGEIQRKNGFVKIDGNVRVSDGRES